MKFFSTISALTVLLLPILTLADTASVAYDETYDNASGSLSTTACSDGANGLEAKFHTFGGLPKFPHIGAAFAVGGWNSPKCGSCWQLTYSGGANGQKKSIDVLAVDHAGPGSFNIALKAMDELTGGLGKQLGRVNVDAVEVPSWRCGM